MGRYNYSLKSGAYLKKIIEQQHDEDRHGLVEILDAIIDCYDELVAIGVIDSYQRDSYVNDIIPLKDDIIDDNEDYYDLSDEVDYELANLYELCDIKRVWL